MNKILKLAFTSLAWLALMPLAMATESDHGFSQLFVFGDSLSDPGNRFAVDGVTANPPFEPIPSAAYGIGGHHYSNGRTWVEVFAQQLSLVESAKPAFRDPAYGNFAYSGARAITTHVPGFDTQVQMFLGIHGCAAPSDALYVVQFGGNDLRDALDAFLAGGNPMPILENSIGTIVSNIGILAQCGATKFLIVNAPNLGAAPAVPAPFKDAVTGLSYGFNLGLNDALNFYFPQGLEFHYLDLFGFVTTATEMPQGFGFTNVISPCLTFGVIEGAYCKNRDQHLFWDAIHPTKKAHRIIGEIALGSIGVTE